MYTYSSKQVKNYYINPSYYVSYFNLRSTSIFSQLDTCKTKTTSEIEACLLLDSPTIKSVMSKSCERKNNREIDMETQCNCIYPLYGHIQKQSGHSHMETNPLTMAKLLLFDLILSMLYIEIAMAQYWKTREVKGPKTTRKPFSLFPFILFRSLFFPIIFLLGKD